MKMKYNVDKQEERLVLNVGNLKENYKSVEVSHKTEEPSLKGAFVSVLMLGSFIFLSWMGVYYLFISR